MLPEEIEINRDIHSSLHAFLDRSGYDNVAVLVDDNTAEHCFPIIEQILTSAQNIQIRSGEEYKNLDTCVKIWEDLTRYQFDRKSLLVNLGGGVIGDMGGFCAATYKRGIDFVNIPTTLLAQVDASVGGKLGIDFRGYKNHIGVFKKPVKVFIDTVFLKTLPEKELRSGFAEVIKHCLIADADYWKKVSSKDFQSQPWPEIVWHSVEVKNRIVEADPHEKGLRKILNFGHTIGHALESFFLTGRKDKLLHGEAIAAGMICEAYLSEMKCGLPQKDVQDIYRYISNTYGKVNITDKDIDALIRICLQDKKNEKGQINFSLLEQTGKPLFNLAVEQDEIRQVLLRYIQN